MDNFANSSFRNNAHYNASGTASATFPGSCVLPHGALRWHYALPADCSSLSQWQALGYGQGEVVDVNPQLDANLTVTSKRLLAMGSRHDHGSLSIPQQSSTSPHCLLSFV
eukprot:TRINITY_DN8491_c0_g2_i1.p4 TRINITY_DN8491_c0_g2~~TRINITY_DN8491_c0_g2_i1.p4  ORF type:complete len:110 (+),score=8.10 TRINITY_DN8491_c0_g2_i1:1063-1392(+)